MTLLVSMCWCRLIMTHVDVSVCQRKEAHSNLMAPLLSQLFCNLSEVYDM